MFYDFTDSDRGVADTRVEGVLKLPLSGFEIAFYISGFYDQKRTAMLKCLTEPGSSSGECYSIFTVICFGFSSSGFGISTSRTPSLNFAFILSGNTVC